MEPPVVRGLLVDLHHGAWRRLGRGPRAYGLGRTEARARAIGRGAPDRAIGYVRGLPPRRAAELSFHACAVRRLVQSRGLRQRLPAWLSAGSRGGFLGRDRAPAPVGPVARGGVLSVLSGVAVDQRVRDAAVAAAKALWRDRLRLLSMALHRRRARFCQALARGGFWRTPVPYRCDLPLLYRPSDRDHHDRSPTARPRSSGLAGSEHRDIGHIGGLRADL